MKYSLYLLILLPSIVYSQEVYNFNFGEKVNKVMQKNLEKTQKKSSETKAKKTEKQWSLSVGGISSATVANNSQLVYNLHRDGDALYTSSGVNVGISRTLNKYFDVDLRMSTLQLDNIKGSPTFTNLRSGIAATPLRIELYKESAVYASGIFGIDFYEQFVLDADTIFSRRRLIAPYFGYKLAAQLNSRVTLVNEFTITKENSRDNFANNFLVSFKI